MTIDVTNLKLDMSKGFTLGEMVWFEEASGLEIHTINRKGPDGERLPPSARQMLGLAYVAAKRQNKAVTLAEVRDIDPADLTVEGGDPLPPPAPPAASVD